jgi:hypothetical protein
MKVTTKSPKAHTVLLETLDPGTTFRTHDLLPSANVGHRYIVGDFNHTFICLDTGAVWTELPKLSVVPVKMEARDL